MSDKKKKSSELFEGEHQYEGGLAVVSTDKVADPGLEPHRVRMTDKSKAHEKRAANQVAALFFASIFGSAFAIYAYFAFPLTEDLGTVRNNTLLLGLGITLGLFGIGFGAVHWAKTLMPDAEVSEPRHQTRGSDETRARAVEIIRLANEESGFSRRKLIRRSLYGALALFPLPAIVLFKDMTTDANPSALLRHTMWKAGDRLTRDPSGTPIKASDVTLGSVFHVIPEGLMNPEDGSHDADMLEQKAKAAVLLVRLDPADIKSDKEAKWGYQGIVAYSKICTHVGCPVALYEQHTHHLLCPCHQSTFDIADDCKVVFGPASRPLPQLPITVDAEGYLVAVSDFEEPVGPSFWERNVK
ncbi:MAG: Rieske 2Fe-2S domain-containing protein [Micrococcales bacterium]